MTELSVSILIVFLVCVVMLVMVPISTFFTVKLGTYAYFRAKYLAKRDLDLEFGNGQNETATRKA